MLAEVPVEFADLEANGTLHDFDVTEVATRFKDRADPSPQTLADCLHEQALWSDLRSAVHFDCADPAPEGNARDWFVFGMRAELRPRSKEEAVAELQFMSEEERLGRRETDAILMNLVGGSA